jgi:hypothetical protein
VQEQSNGRPTYCESRYYRAVANGGQGCNWVFLDEIFGCNSEAIPTFQ